MTSSLNLMRFRTPSRRDDLISLVYFSIFLLNKNLPWYNDEIMSIDNIKIVFNKVEKFKQYSSPKSLCVDNAIPLR
jgi:hypothetical protein